VACDAKQLRDFTWAYKEIGCTLIEPAMPWGNAKWLKVFRQHHMVLLCDEEGAYDTGKFNLCMHHHGMKLFGNILVVNENAKTGTFTPLDEKQVKALVALTDWIETPEEEQPDEQRTLAKVLSDPRLQPTLDTRDLPKVISKETMNALATEVYKRADKEMESRKRKNPIEKEEEEEEGTRKKPK